MMVVLFRSRSGAAQTTTAFAGFHAVTLIILIQMIILAPYSNAVNIPTQRLECDKSEVLFLGKCFCKPGYERENASSPACSIPLMKIGECECEPKLLTVKERDVFLLDPKWTHPSGYRCTALCRYSAEMGVVTSIRQEWDENQKWRQLSFYRKELTVTSLGQRYTHMQQRLDEFSDGFQHFAALNKTNMGHVVEFGAGGYTQTRSILERTDAEMESVTLVDPQIFDYKSIPASSFAEGSLHVPKRHRATDYKTTLSKLTVEEFGQKIISDSVSSGAAKLQYDTVIMMNVLVYARNALEFLTTLHSSLKIGGTLIFHDRWFADSVTSSHCKTAGFAMHIIQVRKELLEHFFSHFSEGPLLSTKQTEGQIDRSKNWCKWKDDEMGYWAIVKKIK